MTYRNVFDTSSDEYDEWFDKYRFVYLSEVELLKSLMGMNGNTLEIGVGSGRFAEPLGIKYGVDPSRSMIEFAARRGVGVVLANGEQLPFKDRSFRAVLLMVTLCFVEDARKVIREAGRVLSENGTIVVGVIDRESELGKSYQAKKKQSKFYEHANFFSANEVVDLLDKNDFKNIRTFQTVFNSLERVRSVEPFETGNGRGGFVAVKGEKNGGSTSFS